MDLSLRGSQINLASRHKPKTTSTKYSTPQRPCSANVLRHDRAATLLRRPMSADEKLARSLKNCVKFSEQVMSEDQLWKNRKFVSESSSNIFKLLLDEPITRSYCPKDSESLSDSSLGRKISDIASKQEQIKETETSERDSNMEKGQTGSQDLENNQNNSGCKLRPHQIDTQFNPQSTLNNGSPYSTKGVLPKLSNIHTKGGDFWHDSKPDLPGRVSFGKADTAELNLTDDFIPSPCDISTSTKKCVHFKESEENFDVNESHNESSTSTCDTNETYSVHHGTNTNKCHCSFTCKPTSDIEFSDSSPNLNGKQESVTSVLEPNLIIEEYKKEIEDEEKKSHLELKMMEKSSDSNSSPGSSTDRVISNYQKLANQIFEDIQSDLMLSTEKSLDTAANEPNDTTLHWKSKNNFIEDTPEEKSDNSTDSSKNQFESLRDFQKSSSTVIKNYLRTTEIKSAPSSHRKVKENNIGANKTEIKSERNRRTKSANNSSVGGLKKMTGMKKVPTYSCLRQDSNLDEFQIEKVDSWMSLHDSNAACRGSPEMECSNRRNPKMKTKSILKHKGNVESPIKSSEDSSPDDSTYEEIVSVIKEIEEDKKKETTASRTDEHLRLQSTFRSTESECMATPKTTERDYSPDKYRDILQYLDNVESSCDKTILETRRSIPESSRSEIEFAIEPDIAEDVPKIADLLMLPNHQLARRIVALSLRANELANAIQLSKQHVSHIRLERQKALRQEKLNSSNRSKEQKKYYESIVARHQGFIEQLLKDKASLCEKVATLTRRIESQNQAWEHRLETELTRAKETAIAGEKIRREKWIRDNTKKIKELTVKGLELEINRMTCEHQKEVTELKRKHQQELLDVVAEERQKHEQLEKSIRDSCAQDRETSISKERDAIRERFEKQLREERQSFDEQKAKLLEEFAAERERMCLELKQKDVDYESKKQDILKEKELAVEQVYNEFKEKSQKQEQKYQTRINTIEKQFESDFLIWKREFENACKLREVENENAVRQHYRSERDRQIDAIVAKMDTETQRCQEEYEMKLSRIKEKHEAELHQIEIAEKQLKDKYNEGRNKLAESEARVQNYQAEVKQLNMELSYSKKMCDKLLEDKEVMKENARREVQQEIALIQAERDSEIEKIYQRVQQAIEKKDIAMELLQKENTTLRERCIKLEAIIRQQRKDYCIK